MLERADAAEAHIAQLLDSLRASADAMVSDLRNGSEQLGRDLAEIRGGLGSLRAARPDPAAAAPRAPEPPPPPPPAPEPEYHEPEPAYQEPEPPYREPQPFPEPEPAPEPEPESQFLAPQPEDESLKYQGDELAPTEEHIPPAPEREPYVPDAEYEAERTPTPEPEPAAAGGGGGGGGGGSEGARLIALNMALNGTPRDETAAYLAENFDLPDQDALLDEVYSRAG